MKRIKSRIVSVALVLSITAQLLYGISFTAFANGGKFLSFAFENFSSGRENIVLSGLSDANPSVYGQYDVRAAYQGDHINLTPKVWAPGIGTAVYKEKITLPEDMSFSTYFTFDMSGPVNDGFVYTLNCDRNTSPTSWASIGMSTSETAINIEFDTSSGGAEVQDTDANHIAVTVSNSGGIKNVGYYKIDSAKMNLQDTRLKHAWIDHDGASNKLYVTVSYTDSRLDGVKAEFDFSDHSAENLFAETLSSNEVYTGFTSITYNTDSPKNINSWYFVNEYEPIDLKNNTYAKCVSKLSVFAIAESSSEGTINVSAVAADNSPVSGAELVISSAAGLFSQQRVVTDENGEAKVQVSGENLTGSIINVSAAGGVVKSTGYFLVKGEDRDISIAYRDFSNVEQNKLLTLSGLSDAIPNPYESYDVRAKIENSVLRLTSKTDFAPVSGAAYYSNRLAIGEDMSFSTYFSFKITPGSVSADGFAFVLNETTDQMTANRTSMAIPNEINSVSVEFDTYYNAENNDIRSGEIDHIAVNINGDIAATPVERQKALSDVDLADGNMKHAWIDYDGANKIFTVTVSNSADKAVGEILSASELDLSGVFSSNMVYAGFVGEHYGSGQNHDIYNWYFDGKYAPIDIRTANYKMLPTVVELEATTYDLAEATVNVKVSYFDGTPASGVEVKAFSSVGTLSPTSGITDDTGSLALNLIGDDLTGVVITATLSSGISGSCVVKVAEDPMKLVVAYDNFDRIARNNLLNLTGGNYSAEIKNAEIVLTEDDANETAGAFLKKKIALTADNSFSTYFTFDISSKDIPADGLAFVIGNKYNTSGYNGVSGTASFSENIAIEFDTYMNESHADPDSNHIGYNLNGSVSSAAVLSLSKIKLADGAKKHVWIDYNGTEDTLEVVISDTSSREDGEKLMVAHANVSSALTSNEVYAGFTASTGSSSARHAVSSWYFDNNYNPIDTSRISEYSFDYTNVQLTSDKLYDISDTARLTLKLVDLQGAPVARREVSFTTDRGLLEFESAVTDADGNISLVYTNTGSKVGTAEIKAVTSDGFIGDILLECLGATAAESKEISFAFDSFGMNDMNKLIKLSGGSEDKSATLSDGVLRLTPNTSGHTIGAAYYLNKIALGDGYSFGTMFTFRVTPGSSAADGFTFTLNNSYNTLNNERHSMGMPYSANSISVEFDTYKNPEHNDPSDNHISINVNGDPQSCPDEYKLELKESGIRIADGNTKYVWISYNGSEKKFTVIISNTSNPDTGKRIDVALDLSSVLSSNEVYAGFTAEHYGSGEQHDITSWYFDNENTVLDTVSTVYTTGAVELSAKTAAVGENKVKIEVAATDYLGMPKQNCNITVLTDKGVLQEVVITTDENGNAVTYITGDSLVGARLKLIADGGAFTDAIIGSLGISIVGDSRVTVELGESYVDQGATAYDLLEGDLTDRITVSGEVDTNVKGTYEITYSVENSSGAVVSAVRTVIVQDVTAPILKLLGAPALTVEGGIRYVDAGASAIDGCDGDITTEIFVYGYVDTKRVGKYILAYEVSDYSGNAAAPVYRTVDVVDTTPPIITLNGPSTVYIEQYDTYTDEGVTVTDNVDKSFWLNRSVEVSGSVNTDVLGSYVLTYNISDENGNSAAAAMRTVVVVECGTIGDYTDSPKTSGSLAPYFAAVILSLGVFVILILQREYEKRRNNS